MSYIVLCHLLSALAALGTITCLIEPWRIFGQIAKELFGLRVRFHRYNNSNIFIVYL
jgi:hypothetical protein